MADTWTDNRVVSAQEMTRLAARIGGTYLFPANAGGAVTSNSNMAPTVAAIRRGHVYVNGVLDVTSFSSTTVTVTTADVTNPRRDWIWYDGAGACGVTAGTPAAAPVLPDLTAGRIGFYEVYVAANDTSIDAADLIDRRAHVGPWQEIVKGATETVNNSNTLQSDDDFLFTAAANTDYLVQMVLFCTMAVASDWKCAWTLTGMTWNFFGALSVGGTPTISDGDSEIASGTSTSVTVNSATVSTPMQFTFLIHGGGTGGTCNFQWAQDTAVAENTSVLKNSWMRYRLLGVT